MSGPAIVDIYEALAALEGRAVVELDDVAIWTIALEAHSEWTLPPAQVTSNSTRYLFHKSSTSSFGVMIVWLFIKTIKKVTAFAQLLCEVKL